MVREVRDVPNSGKLFPWIVPVIATVCFSSLLTQYELYCCCPIVSIDFTVPTTVLGIISLLSNTKKSRLSSVKGFPISSMTGVKDMTSFAKARCVLGVCLWCRVSPVCGF